MRHRWLVYLNILENRTKIITKINKFACIPLFFRIWSKLAAHLHLHMHVKNFLSSNSQMYMIYIVFNSCPVYEMIQNTTVVLKFTKDEKKIFFVKKKMHDDKKKLLVSDNLLFFENYFFCIGMCLLSLRINNSKIYTPNLWVPIRIYHTPG